MRTLLDFLQRMKKEMKFFSKNREDKESRISLDIDIHSHLIPGIDDGSQSLQESIEMIELMSNLGYKKMITTPHVMADSYPNSTETLRNGLEQLKEAIKVAKIDMILEVAAEYYLDELFVERLQSDDILTIGDGYLLFETSYVSKPMNFENIIFDMKVKGYKPILAHPERYRYITQAKEEYRQMKELGLYFQLDINSLGGFYGKQAQEQAKVLMELGMIDFLGSDIHHKRQVSNLAKVLKSRAYQSIWSKNQIKNSRL